jgi:hypothetical protein
MASLGETQRPILERDFKFNLHPQRLASETDYAYWQRLAYIYVLDLIIVSQIVID